MKLLSKLPSLGDYNDDIAQLLQSANTHIYIDTSFLMWLTMLGDASRSEFLSWVNTLGKERFHVPLWASHEYHQHYLSKTLSTQVSDQISNLTKAATSFYKHLAPVLAEANDIPRYNSTVIKNRSREAVLDLQRFGEVMQKWNAATATTRYASIVDLINELCLTSGITFEYFHSMESVTNGRFSGRVPPGFQDRMKKDTESEGGNRAGDLMFWKEILDHVKTNNKYFKRIKAIVILSNDAKNDWLIGKDKVSPSCADDNIRNFHEKYAFDSSQIPIIHPMLEHEAQVYCKVNRVVLMNDFSLGTHFISKGIAPTFIECSVMTELPKENHKNTILSRTFETDSASSQSSAISNRLDSGSAAITATRPTSATVTQIGGFGLNQIISNLPKDAKAEVDKILDEMSSLEGKITTIQKWFNLETITTYNPVILAWTARSIANFAKLGNASFERRVIDLLNLIEGFDLESASKIYAGLLFGIYMDQDNNFYLGAKPDILQNILDHQANNFAIPGLDLLSLKYDKNPPAFALYIPKIQVEPIQAEIQTVPNSTSISTLIIDEVNYFTSLAPDDPFSLKNLIGFNGEKTEITIKEVLTIAAIKLGYPVKQLNIKKPTKKITIMDSDGLEIPV